jgi:hypothetical protein
LIHRSDESSEIEKSAKMSGSLPAFIRLIRAIRGQKFCQIFEPLISAHSRYSQSHLTTRRRALIHRSGESSAIEKSAKISG